MNAPRPATPLRKPDLVGDHPATPAPIYHQIPAELKARKQWVCWRWELDANGKPTKVPYNPRTAGLAKRTRRALGEQSKRPKKPI